MLILGIETSCDDTSVALFETEGLKQIVNNTFSQAGLHSKFGGVVPEVASRNHLLKIAPLFTASLEEAKITARDIGAVAVTNAPGLIGALFVGVSFAKGLGFALHIPVVPVHHLSGHILSAELSNPELKPPYTALVLSGGHSHIYDVTEGERAKSGGLNFELLGRTIDDAAGELFDKIAKTLGGPYPGGPFIEELAGAGDPSAIKLPIALKGADNFSFSGLKTAVLGKIKEGCAPHNIAASLEQTVADTAADKTLSIALRKGRRSVVVTGGVAANSRLNRVFKEKAARKGLEVFFPSKALCGDNALMIAYAAYRLRGGRLSEYYGLDFKAGDTAHEIS